MPQKGYKQNKKHKQNISRAVQEYWDDEERSKDQREKCRELGQENRGKILLSMRGPNNPAWKGGQHLSSDGYVYLLRPNHPHATKDGYVRRSRLMMEEHLGRFLDPEEQVHHDNGIRDDDRIENFILFPSWGKHMAYHRALKRQGCLN